MSLFITFEGIEGSGKTTQIRLLNDALKLRRIETVLTREPGGTAIGEEVRKILLNSANLNMTPLCELFLYAAGRAQHITQVIEPALKAGKTVLCDRFTDATLAYQGYARGFSPDLIKNINRLTVGNIVPHLTFLLDCNAKTGLQRAHERIAKEAAKNQSDDRFEEEPIDFHQKVREGYLSLAREKPERIKVIPADRDVQAIHRDILGEVLKRIPTP